LKKKTLKEIFLRKFEKKAFKEKSNFFTLTINKILDIKVNIILKNYSDFKDQIFA